MTASDFHYAVRRLIRARGFTAIAVLTLALGIGASTAIFSIVNGVLLQPLPFPQQEQLVWLRESMPVFGSEPLPVNAYHFRTWRERAQSFSQLTVVDGRVATLTGADRPELVGLVSVSSGFFDVLGVPPVLGRTFALEEEAEGRDHVVVISDALWQRAFARDPAVIGRSLAIDREPHTIIGVLPADFRFPSARAAIGSAAPTDPDVFRPKVFAPDELRERLGRHNYGAIGRLKPGISLTTAEAELNGIARQITAEAGEPSIVLRAVATPLHEAVVGRSRRGLVVLFAAVTSVLLIGCVNLMNFLLAQAERRQQESAVRQALGASRGRLVRAALTEAMLVALVGGALGVVLARLGLTALLRFAPADLPRVGDISIDAGVLGFALTSTLLTGLLFGFVPAWRLARSDPQQALGAGSRSLASGRQSRRWSDLLVGTEVTLSVVLLALAALLGGSFVRLLRAEQGFRAPTVLSASLTIPYAGYPQPAERFAYFERIVERLQATPGITAAAVTNLLPLDGETWVDKAAIAGDSRPPQEKPNVNTRFVSPEYFQAMGLPLRAGRTFDARDRDRKVTIISEQLARLLWPDQDPVGRRIERNPGEEYEVIGVAADVRPAANRTPVPTVYRQHRDWPFLRMVVVARAATDVRSAAPALRSAIQSIDPQVPVPAFRTMDDLLSASVGAQRFQLLLVAVFAVTALLLTMLGIYGVVAYAIARRRKELGIRMALGATPMSIRALVLRRGMRPVVFGLGAGLALALASGRVLESLLFETRPTDPALLASVAGVLALCALLACYVPGRQAARVDPFEALRAE